MDKNRIVVCLALMIFVMAFVLFNITGVQLLTLAIMCIVIILAAKRAYFYFIRANRIYSARDISRYPEAMELYRKTLRAGISPKYTVLVSTILIQEGDKASGKAALEKLLARKKLRDEQITGQAKCALSLAYYVDKDYESALDLCRQVMQTKYRDNVLYINMCTYLLALGKVKEFKETVEEFSKKTVTSPALLDLQIVYHMLERDYRNAYVMLDSLFEKAGTFTFADPYVHMAQIWIHYHDADKAVEYLEKALEDVVFRPVTIISPNFIRTLIDNLRNPARREIALASYDRKQIDLFNGIVPIDYTGSWQFGSQEEIRQARTLAIEAAKEEELDDKEPNVELTDEDEAWLKRHGED